jgi:hypothetical protein
MEFRGVGFNAGITTTYLDHILIRPLAKNYTQYIPESKNYNIYYHGVGTPRFTINSSGNVGIGTTTPDAKLRVEGGAILNGNVAINNTYTGQALNVGGNLYVISGQVWVNDAYGYTCASSTNTGMFPDSSHNITFKNNNSSNVYIKSDGNVGIGTTSPLQKLHVVGNVYIDDDDTTGNGVILGTGDRPLITRGWDAFTSGNKSGIGRWGIYMESAELFIGCPGTDYSNGLVTIGGWLLGGTRQPNLTVNNYTRNVGIGTTSPGAKLTVRASAAAGATDAVYVDNSSGTNLFEVRDDGLTYLKGNVGIGTTSPVTKTEVYRFETTNRTTYTDILTIHAAANTSPYNGHGGGILFKGTTYNGGDNITWGRIGMYLNGNSVSTAGENMFFAVAANDNSNTLTTAMTIQYNGNVGIGSTSPAYKLDVSGPGRFVSNSSSRVLYLVQDGVNAGNIIQFKDQSNTDIGELVFRNNQFYIYSTATSTIMIYANPANNYVGISTSSPSYILDVSGTIRATGDVIAYSDARVKENVKTIEAPLALVTKLRGVTYTRNDSEDKSRKIGVIAQEVLPILPEVVQQDDKGNYSVAYGNIVGVLIEAIKELKAEIDILKQK